MSWGAKAVVRSTEAVSTGLRVVASAEHGAGVADLHVDLLLPRGVHVEPGDVLNLSCVTQRVDSARA